jgi:hypothetical protein
VFFFGGGTIIRNTAACRTSEWQYTWYNEINSFKGYIPDIPTVITVEYFRKKKSRFKIQKGQRIEREKGCILGAK